MFHVFSDKRRYLAALALFAVSLSPLRAGAGGVSPLGQWTRDDGSVRMAIASCGAQLCAVNTYVKDQQGAERVGDKLVLTLKQTSPTVLSGTAFDVRRNKSYAMTLTLTAGTMKTTGCILLGVLCKSALWTRSG